MATAPPLRPRYDAVVLGGGHNGLTAAAYLARAGRSVLLLERSPQLGGATRSAAPFDGVDVRLSRYSYLVALLPPIVLRELGLDLRLARRPIASYTPDPDGGPGLLIRDGEPPAREAQAWARWGAAVERVAAAVRPTLTQPLPSREAVRRAVGDDAAWEALVERPLGEALEATFADDLVRGVVLTDGLIGTAASAHDPGLLQNRCFLLHALGPWDVPVGGMGAVSGALEAAARAAGADLRTGAEVLAVGDRGEVRFAGADGAEHAVEGGHVLAALGPAVLDRLRGRTPSGPAPQGSQLKLNVVVDRLPRLKDGTPPEHAFAGTFHAGEGYARLEEAHALRAAGRIPDPLPCELYCHTLTDPSILGPAERERGRHTLTLFGLHLPAAAGRAVAVAAALRSVDAHLAEPLMDCVARDAAGRPASRRPRPPTSSATSRSPAATSSIATWRGPGPRRPTRRARGAWARTTPGSCWRAPARGAGAG